MSAVLLVLDVALITLATARLTRLVTVDTIGEPVRKAARWTGYAFAGTAGWDWADELVGCPHCAGFWLSLLVVGSYAAWEQHPWWTTVAGVFAVAYVAGHLVARLDVGDDDG